MEYTAEVRDYNKETKCLEKLSSLLTENKVHLSITYFLDEERIIFTSRQLWSVPTSSWLLLLQSNSEMNQKTLTLLLSVAVL